MDPFELSLNIKTLYPEKPIVILAPDSLEFYNRIKNEDLSGVDYVFSWLGSTNIFLPIINLIEDRLNVEEDSKYEGVQSILMVENSIRMSSVSLRHLYTIILDQSRAYMTEGLNEHQKMMQMRGRPKDPACQQLDRRGSCSESINHDCWVLSRMQTGRAQRLRATPSWLTSAAK